jgi:peptide/nickel transport system permease protein
VSFILKRALLALPVLVGVLTISFFATVSVPGDPLAGLLPENPTAEQHQQAAREFGIDRPLPERWARYVVRTVQGDLGRSLRTGRPVAVDLGQSAIATVELALVAFVITAVMGIAVGIVSAVGENKLVDNVLSVISIGGIAAPIFWTALMLQLVFYGQLGWLPAGGRINHLTELMSPFPRVTGLYTVDALFAGNLAAFGDAARHLVLPALVLAYRAMALVTRITRTAMIETLRAPYVQTARAFGLRERRLVTYHAFKNALPPILTALGLAFGELLAGSFLVETVFNWPGLGLYALQSIAALDYPGIVGVSMFIAVVYVGVNLVIDLMYPLVDPRLRAA